MRPKPIAPGADEIESDIAAQFAAVGGEWDVLKHGSLDSRILGWMREEFRRTKQPIHSRSIADGIGEEFGHVTKRISIMKGNGQVISVPGGRGMFIPRMV